MKESRPYTVTISAYGGEEEIAFTITARDEITAIEIAGQAYTAVAHRRPANVVLT